jgi:hypothetical protein
MVFSSRFKSDYNENFVWKRHLLSLSLCNLWFAWMAVNSFVVRALKLSHSAPPLKARIIVQAKPYYIYVYMQCRVLQGETSVRSCMCKANC